MLTPQERIDIKKLGANEAQLLVQNFQEVFSHFVSKKPALLDADLHRTRAYFETEELVEGLWAVADSREDFQSLVNDVISAVRLSGEVVLSKTKGCPSDQTIQERLIAEYDATADRIFFALGRLVMQGGDIGFLMNTVYDSNMTKLFINEKTGKKEPRYTTDGRNKVIKSPEFREPESYINEWITTQLDGKDPAIITEETIKAQASESFGIEPSNPFTDLTKEIHHTNLKRDTLYKDFFENHFNEHLYNTLEKMYPGVTSPIYRMSIETGMPHPGNASGYITDVHYYNEQGDYINMDLISSENFYDYEQPTFTTDVMALLNEYGLQELLTYSPHLKNPNYQNTKVVVKNDWTEIS